MKTNYVLVDCENVMPDNLARLDKEWFRVLLFVGANQTKIPFSLVKEVQKFGERAEYIEIAGTGHNALDFHIAYYIGLVSAKEPDAYFHIVSNDSGFDPLITHLKSQKIFADRVSDIKLIPVLAIEELTTKTLSEKLAFVKERLLGVNVTRPRSRKTLTSHIATMFGKKLPENEVEKLVGQLFVDGIVKENGKRLEYAGE